MKLNRKTFIYSLILSFSILALFLSYMLLMLPSLYVEHSKRSNLNNVVDMHYLFVENKEYQGNASGKNINTISGYIKKDSYNIVLSNYFFGGKIELVDGKLKKEIDELRSNLKNENFEIDDDFEEKFDKKMEEFFSNEFFKNQETELSKYAKFNFKATDFAEEYSNIGKLSNEIKQYGNNTFLFMSNSDDETNNYTNYFLLTKDKGNIYISFASLLTPLITDIKAPIYSSIPMIILVILLFSILISKYFSNKIVNPILEITDHVENNKELSINEIKTLNIQTGDEIEQLSKRLNELYEILKQNYNELEIENKRREVFMRSSSHQLKTPISAALLLVNGMIDKVGKYENRDIYLPEVKKQILEMNNIVSEVLKLNHVSENISIEKINLSDLVKYIIEKYNVIIEKKEIKIEIDNSNIVLETDYEIIYKIFDNLINNAVKHSNNFAEIKIILQENKFEILNTNIEIPKDIEENIFEPFISNNNKKGHGLGLYIVSYYAEILGYKVVVKNVKDGVLSLVEF